MRKSLTRLMLIGLMTFGMFMSVAPTIGNAAVGGGHGARLSTAQQASLVASSYGCYGAGCYGLDPVQEGCYNSAPGIPAAYSANSASIMAVNHITGQQYVLGTVQIWYSPGCDANWSRAYTNDGSKVTFITVEACAKTYANVTSCSSFPCPENQSGNECTTYTRYNDNAAYSDMVDGSYEVTADGTIGLTYNQEDIYGASTSA